MARHIEHSAQYPHPVATLHAALTDERYWHARLQEVGGPGAKLDEVTLGDGTVAVAMTQSVPAEHLPAMVTKVRPGDLIIKRTESWGPLHGDRAEGTFSAEVEGAPGQLRGTMTLTADGDGSLLVMEGEVEVKLPLIGGKVESVIAGQVLELLDAEEDFTGQWTASK
ncbi:DUF2505 domain-containing protein [Prescottella agglutinans]|uniref:DUF2505 domain-containing protein n=1 Tax=Prescottella agglutinans TaxID=1644129 RepID=A0A3S3AHB7_9NOCA|nr:DUF2505 domain-containing protein [Prescottella agglutinans]RVW10120.1 DUF2505 domain-containing protein [Prescottella agglutinans]